VGATGGLTVLVSRPATDVSAGLPTYPATAPAPARTEARSGTGLVTETVSVPATSSTVRSSGSLRQGVSYRVTVGGAAGLGTGPHGAAVTDGRCVYVEGAWRMTASMDPRFPGAEHGRLYVDGAPFVGKAPAGRTCASRTHVLDYTAPRTGRLELAIWDPLSRSDNSGSLSVAVQRLTPVTAPVAAAAERPATTMRWTQASDAVRVLADEQGGSLSTMRLRAGQTVQLTVSGTQRSGTELADASCVRTTAGWRAADTRVALGQDPMALWADGTPPAWHPVGRRSGCAPDHRYTARFVATKNGPVRFAVLDLDHRDNAGVLAVSLRRL
jgi:hypothetical protein